MIAFDLDGIFLNDFDSNKNTFKDFIFIRNEVTPIFYPLYPFVIITGRPFEDEKSTRKWINNFFIYKPNNIYFNNVNFFSIKNSIDFKINILKSLPEVSVFIESCPKQSEEIKKFIKDKKIITFSSFINESIGKLLYE